MMERKIGEVFDCTLENGEVVSLQVIEAEGCNKCFLEGTKDCKFTHEQRGDCVYRSFIKVKNHKLPEINKEKQQKAKKTLLDLAQESDTFNSQIEIWRYLSESEENIIENKQTGEIFKFKNGSLNGRVDFINYKNWKKCIPPKTITVNGVEIEAPLRSLEGVDVVYVPCFYSGNKYDYFEYDVKFAKTALNNNMAFATPEAAIACHDALLKGIIISH